MKQAASLRVNTNSEASRYKSPSIARGHPNRTHTLTSSVTYHSSLRLHTTHILFLLSSSHSWAFSPSPWLLFYGTNGAPGGWSPRSWAVNEETCSDLHVSLPLSQEHKNRDQGAEEGGK
ncbi:hypothetical protein TgHK011_005668 [Trichoderma gracile]|nr:hypothetical protein TgHK011_005668 [Trichoderma gracile]